MQGNEKQSSSFRWWEFYAVRYAMGTVVGGVVFFFLCFYNPELKPLLFGADIGKLDGPRLWLFAAYGLAYCYIASAPILVLHTGRFLLQLKSDTTDKAYQALMLTWLPLLLAMMAFNHTPSPDISSKLFFASSTFLFVQVVYLSLVVVIFALWKSQDLYDFYVRLDVQRANTRGELIDSYRHLREHGNSFFIVFLEIVFAIILYAAGDAAQVIFGQQLNKSAYVLPYVLVLLLWTFPAVLVWFVGTVIERRFSEQGPQPISQPDAAQGR